MNRFGALVISFVLVLFTGGCGFFSDDSKEQKAESDSKVQETDKAKQGSSGEKVEVSTEVQKENKKGNDKKEQKIPFEVKDFVLTVTPTGEIDSVGGAGYSYNIQNNSPIPAKEMVLNIKFEFENGNSQVQNVRIDHTIMSEESLGGSYKVYPKPASHIKSYQLIGYQLIDADGKQYLVDLQLETAEVSKSIRERVDLSENAPFKMDDFVLTVTPTGEIDSVGGVGYSYNIQNNSSIPAKEMVLNIKFEFENGNSQVQNVRVNNTIMNGESLGDSYKVYPEPASKIKSYQLIGYQLVDKDDSRYIVDTQLKTITQ